MSLLKSILLSHMAVGKFQRGEAVFVLDPHGDLVDNILKMLPKEWMEKVVVINFGLEDFTPQLTIWDNVDITVPSKVSDDMTEAMKDVGSDRNKFFGLKMAYILSCLYFIYCVIPEFNLMNLRQIVSKSKKAKTMRAK